MSNIATKSNKRGRPGPVQEGRKRRKVEVDRSPKVNGASAARVQATSVDKLPWKAFNLPERLDDAEGFYGLEEIADVEVVRDANTGIVSYRTAAGPNSSAVKTQEERADESDWEGFEPEAHGNDTVSAEGSSQNHRTKTLTRQEPKRDKKAKGESKANGKAHGLSQSAANGGNAFASLSQPDQHECDVSAWEPLGLSPDILVALGRLKFTNPTPIQIAAIPEIIKGRDVVGKAATGSGKTLAFGIPIVQDFLSRSENSRQTSDEEDKQPTAMILSPTRELAHQLSEHIAALCTNMPSQGPRIATVTGGLSVLKQQRQLKTADVIIGTPGRLWEVINSQEGLLSSLRKINFLVVDEADRLLSEGQFKEVEEILNSLDRGDVKKDEDGTSEAEGPRRQTLVFSATFQKDLQRKLAGKGKQKDSGIMSQQDSTQYLLQKLNFREERPKFLDVNPISQMAANLKEGLIECAALEKDLYLYTLLMHYPRARILIFANSIAGVRRLAPFLQHLNLPAYALHSQMPQKARLRAIERFSKQSAAGSILVATDVAARGLDIPAVQLIVHYHLPRAADAYVHRSGRTARAQASGLSVLLCAPDEVVPVRRLVAKVHARNAASAATSGSDRGSKFFIRTLDLDRQLATRLKPRVTIAKQIADADLAREKHHTEDSWLKTAAEELGVDYDSEEFKVEEGGRGIKGGRGKERRQKEERARGITEGERGRMKAELKALLAQKVNVGVSEKYLSAGGVDVDELLREKERQGEDGGMWLGNMKGLDFD